MAANGTELLVFIDDVTADRSRRMNSDACRARLSDLHSADGLRAITCRESIPRVSRGKKMKYSPVAKSVNRSDVIDLLFT